MCKRWYRVRRCELNFLESVGDSAIRVSAERVWAVEGTDDYCGKIWDPVVYCRGSRDHAERAMRAVIAENGGEVYDERAAWSLRDPNELLLGEDYATMYLDLD